MATENKVIGEIVNGEEAALIRMYRALQPEQKRIVLEAANTIADRSEES